MPTVFRTQGAFQLGSVEGGIDVAEVALPFGTEPVGRVVVAGLGLGRRVAFALAVQVGLHTHTHTYDTSARVCQGHVVDGTAGGSRSGVRTSSRVFGGGACVVVVGGAASV